MKTRPRGVWIYSVVSLFCWGWYLVALGTAGRPIFDFRLMAWALGLIGLGMSIGVWSLSNVARLLALVVAGLMMVFLIWAVVRVFPTIWESPGIFLLHGAPITILASLGWNGWIIWYFLQPGVKAQFLKRR